MPNASIRGADRLQRRIATIRRNLDVPELRQEMAVLLVSRIRARFDKQVDPDLKPWTPLKPSTLKIKRILGYPATILVRTQRLRNSIGVLSGSNQGLFGSATGAGFRIGVTDPIAAKYARLHQNGVPGKLAQRRIFGINDLDVKAVDALLRRRAARLMQG